MLDFFFAVIHFWFMEHVRLSLMATWFASFLVYDLKFSGNSARGKVLHALIKSEPFVGKEVNFACLHIKMLDSHNDKPKCHFELNRIKVKKKYAKECSPRRVERIYDTQTTDERLHKGVLGVIKI